MASIERHVLDKRDGPGRMRRVVRYKVRYRDPDGRSHSETFSRLADAERRRTEIEASLVSATWLDPRRGEIAFVEWARDWLPTRHDLRATTWARLETTMERQVLPRFGSIPLRHITNAEVRLWVRDLLAQGLSAATARKAVFALRQCLAAAVADGRVMTNPRRDSLAIGAAAPGPLPVAAGGGAARCRDAAALPGPRPGRCVRGVAVG